MPTVLIVDDSPIERRLARGLLAQESDWTLLEAVDGEDALDVVAEAAPDLVLTDLSMPRMDGLELVLRLKHDFPLLPVVLMTAQGSEAIAVNALQGGAAGYVSKARLAEDLPALVERVLTTALSQRNLVQVQRRLTQLRQQYMLENDFQLVTSLPAQVLQVEHAAGFTHGSEQLRVSVALEEALLNALYHGNLEVTPGLRETNPQEYHALSQRRALQQPYADRRLSVSVESTPHESAYEIRDEGPGFDHSRLPNPHDPANLDLPHGRGLLLMQTFMDEVHFTPPGNTVRLVKYR